MQDREPLFVFIGLEYSFLIPNVSTIMSVRKRGYFLLGAAGGLAAVLLGDNT